MKYLLVILLCLFAFSAQAAPFLVCDPSPDVIATVEVEMNGTVYTGTYIVSGADIILYDLAGIPSGSYVARARWSEGTLWSDWSNTINFKKTGRPGNIHIK
jgi:hypothetical protein